MDSNHSGFNEEKELIFRMDERIYLISTEILHIKEFLESKVMTKDLCNLAQSQHDKSRALDRLESMSKSFAIISVSAGILWAIFKHA